MLFVLRTYKTNYQGGFHQTDVLLDFTGKVNTTFTSHKYRPSDTPVEIEERYFYSPQDRLEMIQHIINNTHKEMILKNEYDALGQLISKRVGGDSSVSEDGYQKIKYQYNIRGWLTDINNIGHLDIDSGLFEDLFAFQIRYDNPDGHYNGEVDALYNGNISETFWISNTDGVLRKYGYKYDPLNRLKDAYFQRPYSINPVCSSYDEYLSYDKNGNILSLIRNGHLESVFQPNLIDELEYFYQGNRLTRVKDHSENPNGFKDDENNTNDPDYLYDDFGNMVYDENKKIELIEYNHLNLPTTIFLANGTISYLYNAAGQKLRKTIQYFNATYDASITEYLDGFQYNNAVLQFFSHPEGYVLNTPDKYGDPSYDYVYQYKDHLGNIRMNFVFDSDAADLKVLEENHYYPFGLKHENYNVTKKKMKWESELIGGEEMELKRVRQVPNSGYQYKYGGNELQDELNLNVYALGWRDYDPALGRFNKLDRFSEKYYDKTPYSYAGNNPVLVNDIQGDSLWISLGKNERVLYENGKLFSKGEDGSFSDYKGSQARLDKKGNVKGYKGILGETVKTLNKLQNGSDFANTLITTLQSSDNNFTINSGYNTTSRVQLDLNSPDGRTGFLNNNAYAFQVLEQGKTLVDYAPFNQIGSGGYIFWNPSDGMFGLGHELGHAYDANFGLLDSRRAPINGGFEEIREIRGVYYENRIRQDFGKRLRKNYNGGPRLIDSKKNPIFHQNPLPSIFKFLGL